MKSPVSALAVAAIAVAGIVVRVGIVGGLGSLVAAGFAASQGSRIASDFVALAGVGVEAVVLGVAVTLLVVVIDFIRYARTTSTASILLDQMQRKYGAR